MPYRALLFVALLFLVAGGHVRADDRVGRHAGQTRATSDAERTLVSIDQEQQALRVEMDALGTKESAAHRRMLLRGRVTYRLVRLGLLPASGGFSSLLEHAFKFERARRALDQDVADVRAIGQRKIAVARKLDELSARRSPLEVERDVAAQSKALANEGEERRRSFDRAFETSTGAGDYVAVYGGSLGGPSGPAAPSSAGANAFADMKGRLPFPIGGRAEIRNVHRPGAAGAALEMTAPAGTAVRAVFAGRVAFADRYDSFGQLVILDHGGHYYTLMGDLSAIDVRVGDDLSAGAKVGTVGSATAEESTATESGSGKERPRPRSPALYFELRHGTTAMDPGPWFGL
ncbi:MAG TPA: peptidoglycan DD-metalloendopeptidase family protein [Polyangiaceae bacterium]|nr:peptidoglycan DD-metalloendopeptidase family protein [Polyangiaceae bacterium]